MAGQVYCCLLLLLVVYFTFIPSLTHAHIHAHARRTRSHSHSHSLTHSLTHSLSGLRSSLRQGDRFEKHKLEQIESERIEENFERMGRSLCRLYGKVRLCQTCQRTYAQTRSRLRQGRIVIIIFVIIRIFSRDMMRRREKDCAIESASERVKARVFF